MDTDKKHKVGIVGSYGGMNLGDEAILEAMITELRKAVPVEITVFSRNPEDTLSRHNVERAVAVRDLTREEVTNEIKNLDLLILGGGGILYDAEAKNYLREVMLAHEMGIPVMTYAIGAGPLDDANVQSVVREALNGAAVITVREKGAQKVLEEAGVEREIIVTADPALLLQPETVPEEVLTREHMDGGRRLVGMSVREPGAAAPDMDIDAYHALLASAADYMIDRYDADVIFVPMERKVLDLQHSHAVVSQMLRPQSAWVLKGEYNSGQVLSLMKHFDFAVGMRLHFLIFAAIQGVPFVALPYASKVSGFLQDLEVKAPPAQLVNAGRLIAHLDYFWDFREKLQEKICGKIPELQERARKTNELALGLLDKDIGKPEEGGDSLLGRKATGADEESRGHASP